jgi:hypothetical protein
MNGKIDNNNNKNNNNNINNNNNESKRTLWVVIGVIVLIIVCIVIGLLMKQSESSEDEDRKKDWELFELTEENSEQNIEDLFKNTITDMNLNADDFDITTEDPTVSADDTVYIENQQLSNTKRKTLRLSCDQGIDDSHQKMGRILKNMCVRNRYMDNYYKLKDITEEKELLRVVHSSGEYTTDKFGTGDTVNRDVLSVYDEIAIYRITLISYEQKISYDENNNQTVQFEEYTFADPLVFETNQENATWSRSTFSHENSQIPTDFECDVKHFHYSHATDIKFDPITLDFEWMEWGPHCHCSNSDDLDPESIDWTNDYVGVLIQLKYGEFTRYGDGLRNVYLKMTVDDITE